ncbi:MAG: carbohydrate binding family 9 domain-containing protein [Acidobacteria bacterium]|nr:carbohydrate binding family 9 domain-containing protein [Acidobacteriota bacterium]
MRSFVAKRCLFYIFIITYLFLISIFSAEEQKLVTKELIKKATAAAITGSIVIDGKLDEPEWNEAKYIGPLRQQEPNENGEPTQETRVKALYNKEYLYLGIICSDDSPNDIIALQMERDSDPNADDCIMIVLDTFNDKRNAYVFVVSPVGMKFDGIVYNNSEEIDGDWDGIWYSQVTQSDTEWVVEMAIPFKTLTFDPRITEWGFNVIRNIKRNEEIDKWAHPYHDASAYNPALAGTIGSFEGMEQGMGLDIRPFIVAGAMKLENETEAEENFDAGIDVFYNITANLKASLTVNTDFAETEVDSRQINLTRFPIIYPEKRDFFLEGAGLYQMPRMNEDVIPFFSRRIGLLQCEEIPIDWGMKLTGRIGDFNVGLLDVQTGETNSLPTQNLLAMRITRNLWEQSNIGVIVTNGNPSGIGSNTLYGADFRYGTSKAFGNKNLYFTANYMKTDSSELPDLDNESWKLSLDFPNDLIDCAAEYWEIGENFNPALGYLRRNNIKNLRIFLNIAPRPDISWIRQLYFYAYLNQIWDRETGEYSEGSFVLIPLSVEFESGDYLEFEILRKFDRLEDGFEITDSIILPPEEYDFTRYIINASTTGKRGFFVHGNYQWGNYYSGSINEYEAYAAIKPNKHLFASVFGHTSEVNLPEGDFTARIIGANLIIKINPDLSMNSIIQYDNESEILGIFAKIYWIPQEGSRFYLVYRHNWEKNGDSFREYNWSINLKYQHSIRF